MPNPRRSPATRLPRLAALLALCAALPLAMRALAPPSALPQVVADLAAACADRRPYLVTACYAPTAGDPAPSQPALVLFRDTPDDGGQRVLAGLAQVGSVWGLAYDPAGEALYVGAFRKRGVSPGPGGAGAVYRLDLASGEVHVFARLPQGSDLGGAAPVVGDRDDAAALHEAGRQGLGDLDLDAEAGQLFAVNLADRRIHALALDDGRHLGSWPHGAAAEPWAAEARPFGLALHEGRLYHALVRSAEAGGREGDLEARVYSSRYDGGDPRLEARLPLGGPRGSLRQAPDAAAQSLSWQPWRDTLPELEAGTLALGPQPLAADIAFTAAGEMVLGLRDRLTDMSDPALAAGLPLALGLGDLRVARREAGGWRFLPVGGRFADAIAGSDHAAQGGLAAWPQGRALISAELARLPSLSAGSAMRASWYGAADGQRRAAEGLCPSGATLPGLWERTGRRTSRPSWPARRALADTTSFNSPRSSGDLELLCDTEAVGRAPDPGGGGQRLLLPWSGH